eukprot:9402502-Lingulodinium_polyedra.AAC.1
MPPLHSACLLRQHSGCSRHSCPHPSARRSPPPPPERAILGPSHGACDMPHLRHGATWQHQLF